ncbi:sugar ABC transporter ATP-binding protein [Azospirillum thermophilum]|uniref:D-xylose ABC transporter ATP-binding protein n=1 Tax=Azospirillum thermophilum TaxID=2202148 RepID=A0A2S2CZI8_9PROT|nr:ATP-binding cassette domain-containing protein [Azospirillum thermophilum]AWK89926.1 D-xylose ABC transporter ATP-binding protein [Azospirillum thermophilum]
MDSAPEPAGSGLLLDLRGVGKGFNGVPVLQGVDFSLHAGEVMALIGENGAGKSTLMRIVTGIIPADSADAMLFRGGPARFTAPRQAIDAGIAMIHQELNLLPHLSVAENIWLGREPLTRLGLIDRTLMRREAAMLLERLRQPIDPDRPVGSLSVGQQQMVEIARALSLNAELLIMDEPTDALTDVETAVLFEVIRSLKAQGKGIVYISHRLGEIFALCDSVTVLRDGHMVHRGPVAELDEGTLIRHMVGRAITDQYPYLSCPAGPERLAVDGLSAEGVSDVSFTAAGGEILGFAGLMGAGRTELGKAIFGANPIRAGRVRVDGAEVRLRHPCDGVAAGIAYVPEDRKAEGLIQGHSIRTNMSLAALAQFCHPGGVIRRGDERTAVDRFMGAFAVKAHGIGAEVRTLSGGNQQKVSLAKALMLSPKVVILDEPTRGVDVGARREIYSLINELKAKGLCILLMSSDMPELLGLSDRILVMAGGRLTGGFARGEATQEKIMACAVG